MHLPFLFTLFPKQALSFTKQQPKVNTVDPDSAVTATKKISPGAGFGMNQIRPSWHEKLEKLCTWEIFQCRRSGMYTLKSDTDFSIPDLESRIPDPATKRHRIPDPDTQQLIDLSVSRIPDPGLFLFRIPDPWPKKHCIPGPGSAKLHFLFLSIKFDAHYKQNGAVLL